MDQKVRTSLKSYTLGLIAVGLAVLLRWLLDPLMERMRGFDFNGRSLDVRENVAFQGKGEQTRFVHVRYEGRGCAIAFEFKKFYMDEWSGKPNLAEVEAMRGLIAFTAAAAAELLE